MIFNELPEEEFDIVACLAERLTGVAAARLILSSQPLAAAKVLEIFDAQEDPRFSGMCIPETVQPVRFYARYPPLSQTGQDLGSLCLYHSATFTLDERMRAGLVWLAAQVGNALSAPAIADNFSLKPSGESISALDLLNTRHQLLEQINNLLLQAGPNPFALLRCQLREYGNVSATLGEGLAEALMEESARRLRNGAPTSASLARFF